MKKINLFLCASLMSVGAYAQQTVLDSNANSIADTTQKLVEEIQTLPIDTSKIVETVISDVEEEAVSDVAAVKEELDTIVSIAEDTVAKVLGVVNDSTNAKQPTAKPGFSFKNGWSVGLSLYQIAPGLTIGKTLIQDKLYLRLGFNTLAFNLPNSVVEPISEDSTITEAGQLNITRGYLAFDYQIKGMFSITAGAQYNDFGGQLVFAKNEDYIYTETVTVNGTELDAIATIPKELIGNIRIDLESAKFAPFVGLALGRAVPNKKLGFRFEAGLVFQGAMKATLIEKSIDTGIVGPDNENIIFLVGENEDPALTEDLSRDIIDQIADVNTQLSKYAFLPYISFTLSYKIK